MNRLILAETSQDSVFWEKDARYTYYKHGPLARSVIGDQLVQGTDYAYTLQGWIKGVNATSLNPVYDMGGDGLSSGSNQYVAKDALSYSLNYYAGDYSRITGIDPFPGSSAYLGTSYKPLYNGNISSMTVNIGKFNDPMLYAYSYDQLNRITGMDAFNGLDQGDNNWEALSSMDAYQERVSYDANGNILTYLRKGEATNLNMDDLTYHYNLDGQGRLLNNRLDHVSDAVGATQHAEDIDDENAGNYTYDEIGNLTSDVKENISAISWTVYGKIASITKTNDPSGVSSINYTYDASGNRISKAVTNTNGTIATTWYVRDASGNVMATYSASGSSSSGPETHSLVLSEQHIYGSSRLGILSRNVDMKTAYIPPLTVDFIRGLKSYELSNHLGNVLVTISDKKAGHDAGNGNYDYFEADVLTANDYYPFGMMMPGRKYSAANAYRFGFNGKENDNEVKGVDGSQQDYGMRVYDPRLGKFLSVDPLNSDYSWLSPYQFASNSPILFVDIDGLEGGNSLVEEMKRAAAQWNNWNFTDKAAWGLAVHENLYGNNKVGTHDGVAMLALRTVALKLDPNVTNYSEEQKRQQFNTNSMSTVAILLWEFATGSGPSERTFNYGSHPFAQDFVMGTEGSIFNGRSIWLEVLEELKNQIVKRISNNSESYIDCLMQGKSYYFGLPFSPDDAGLFESAQKHIESNLSQFFIGGANVTVTPESETSIEVTISNGTTRSSLGLHLLKNFTDQSIYYDNRTPLSNIKQIIRFRIINIQSKFLNPRKDPLDGQAIREDQKIQRNGSTV